MYYPSDFFVLRLPDCGHTFCCGCIEWGMVSTICDHMQYLGVHHPNPEETSITDIIAFREHMVSLGLGVPVHRCPKCGMAIRNKPVRSFTLDGILDETGRFRQREDISCSRAATPTILDWARVGIEAIQWGAYGYEWQHLKCSGTIDSMSALIV